MGACLLGVSATVTEVERYVLAEDMTELDISRAPITCRAMEKAVAAGMCRDRLYSVCTVLHQCYFDAGDDFLRNVRIFSTIDFTHTGWARYVDFREIVAYDVKPHK